MVKLVGDFETTVYENQDHTEVWASALANFENDNVEIHHSIEETYNYLVSQKQSYIIYYHNLKFDGSFWLNYLLDVKHYETAYRNGHFIKPKFMESKTVSYTISASGLWYKIVIKVNSKITITLIDSYKLLPFSVKKIGKSFSTRRKTEIEYTGYRFSGCEISGIEREYISNDVLIVRDGLRYVFDEGHEKITIGSCCMSEFKKTYDTIDYKNFFPDLTCVNTPEYIRDENAFKYIYRFYRGAWTHLKKGCSRKMFYNGATFDANSLYPSVMESESGNEYPVGKPIFFQGKPDFCENFIYFIHIKCKFEIKKNHLPFIQIKRSPLYPSRKHLTTHKYYDYKTKRYYSRILEEDGSLTEIKPDLYLTEEYYKLLFEQYDVWDIEYIDGCYFYKELGLFDNYIKYFKDIKVNAIGAKRELAKLFLNNLYGKLATNEDSSYKLCYIEDGVLKFKTIEEFNKKTGYIPCGACITAYAAATTIRLAQLNYNVFIYADTDSLHIEGEEIVGVKIHPTEFQCWDKESTWDKAWFLRAKAYIEVKGEEYNIKCAGLPSSCKEYFLECIGAKEIDNENHTPERIKLYDDHIHDITDFVPGLRLPLKLKQTNIKGGTVLEETEFTIKRSLYE